MSESSEHIVTIEQIRQVTHNVRSYRLTKPAGFRFEPGQATDVSINLPEWRDELRPFTFTSLNEEPTLEFTIKSYRDHDGVTKKIGELKEGDSLIIRDVWGAIAYKGEGYFIAGGAGITPFIAILRQLFRSGQIGGNKLFFSNRTNRDIILENELTAMLGGNAVYLITDEAPRTGYRDGRIDEDFLKREANDFSKHFYVCGPEPMQLELSATIARLGAPADFVVFEK